MNFEPVVLNTIRETSILLFLDIGITAHAFLFVGSRDRLQPCRSLGSAGHAHLSANI